MRLPLSVGAVLLFCSLAHAIGYDDFPAELQPILTERIADLHGKGGTCVAGRVTFDDGAPISGGADVKVNLSSGGDIPIRVYAGGWLIMEHSLFKDVRLPKPLHVRAFKYEPVDTVVALLRDEITYVEVHMNRTPLEDLADVTGTVTDEKGQPFNGARVLLDFQWASCGSCSSPRQRLTTGSDGRFSFTGISSTEYYLIAMADEYAYHSGWFTPPPGETIVQVRKLYPLRRITLDYAYQAAPTRTFAGVGIQTGFIDWLVQAGGIDFSQARVEDYEYDSLRDLELRQDQDVLYFGLFYVNGRNGYYPAGAVPLESLLEAAEAGYDDGSHPCLVDHAYVVRTYDDRYAKLIVKSNERWFETVLPGDPEPIEFADYRVWIDLAEVSTAGKLYVQTHPHPPAGIHATLPHYLTLSGMSGATFRAHLQLSYQDEEVAASGFSEDTLSIVNSCEDGETWQVLATERDPATNALRVGAFTGLGWFAIADNRDGDGDGVLDLVDSCLQTPPGLLVDASGCPFPVPGDFDNDFDVDQEDYGRMQVCLDQYVAPEHPECARADFDASNRVTFADLTSFLRCVSGPTYIGRQSCAD